MDSNEEKPYFAPPAEGVTPDGEAPVWGEDAKEIARQAGLGSYGPDPTAQESREEALIRNFDRIDGDVAGLRGVVVVLCIVTGVLAALMAWVLTH